MKRLIPAFLCLFLSISFLLSCENGDIGSSPDDSSSTVVSDPHIKSEPIKITLMMAESDTEFPLAKTQNFREIQEIALNKFNIDYRLETFLSSEGNSVVSTRLAAGVDLPDVINFLYSRERMNDLYRNDLILRLNELIDEYSPNYAALLDIRPYLIIAHSNADGDILRMAANYEETPQHCVQVLSIRNDWLKKIGMDYTYLKTPDDLYLALKAFQENDVNGSGKPDEVLTASGAYAIYDIMSVLGTAFGVPNATQSANSWYFDEDGKVYNCITQPGSYELAAYLNKLYAEGLLDGSVVSQTNDSYNRKLATNMLAGRTSHYWESVLMNISIRDRGFTEAEYIPIALPISNDGNPMHYYLDLPGYGGYMFTKNCADPVALMRFFDWGYSLEGSVKNYYGVDDIDIGSEYFTKAIPLPGLVLPPDQMDATPYYNEQMNDEPLLIHKNGWNQEFTPKLFMGNSDMVIQEFYVTFTTERCGLAAEIDFNRQGLDDLVKYGIPACNFAAPTDEESEAWGAFVDLWIYMDMMYTRFITGEEPLTNWDTFVRECENQGLSKAISIRQAQYDRCIEIMGER